MTTKQTEVVEQLKKQWEARDVEVEAIEVIEEAGKVVVAVGDGWPVVQIGKQGGVDVPQLKSYADGKEAAVVADQMLAKQTEREVKRAAKKEAEAAKKEAEAAA